MLQLILAGHIVQVGTVRALAEGQCILRLIDILEG